MIKNFESYVNKFFHKLNEEIEYDYYEAPQEYVDNNKIYLYEVNELDKKRVYPESDPYGEEDWEWESFEVLSKEKIEITKIVYEKGDEGGDLYCFYKIFMKFKGEKYCIYYSSGRLGNIYERYIKVNQPTYEEHGHPITVVSIYASDGDNFVNREVNFDIYAINVDELKKIEYDESWAWVGCNY